jgi:hypothetical protein
LCGRESKKPTDQCDNSPTGTLLKIRSQHQSFQPIIGITKGDDNVRYIFSGLEKNFASFKRPFLKKYGSVKK